MKRSWDIATAAIVGVVRTDWERGSLLSKIDAELGKFGGQSMNACIQSVRNPCLLLFEISRIFTQDRGSSEPLLVVGTTGNLWKCG